MTRAVFVAGSGTDVGKTTVGACLLSAWARRGIAGRGVKPVATGVDPGALPESDAGRLLLARGKHVDMASIAAISPWSYPEAISPHLAGGEGGPLLDEVVGWCRAQLTEAREEWLLIESAGGILSPLDRSHTMLDWVKALDLPVLLAGDTRLGAVSQLLAAEYVVMNEGLKLAGMVISESIVNGMPPGEQIAAIARLSRSGQTSHLLPRLDGQAKATQDAEDALSIWLEERLPRR